jgi:transcriptional regulator with XRE-family HTH domain
VIAKEEQVHPGKELSRARRESGRSLRKLAAFANTSSAAISQIETGKRGVSFERLQSLLYLSGHRLVSISTNAKTPDEVTEFIKSALDADNPQRAYRAFLAYSQALRDLDPGVRLALTLNRPESTGDSLYDAAMASLIRHWLSVDHLPLPSWVSDDSYRLSAISHLSGASWECAPEISEVPEAFLIHNVLFPAASLESFYDSENSL